MVIARPSEKGKVHGYRKLGGFIHISVDQSAFTFFFAWK